MSLENGQTRLGIVKTGSSYASQSELPVTIGLGGAVKVKAIEVSWPSGQVDRLPSTAADQTLTVEEGKGIVYRGQASLENLQRYARLFMPLEDLIEILLGTPPLRQVRGRLSSPLLSQRERGWG